MKRVVKKGLRAFIIMAILFVFTVVFARYGWKLFGFSMCVSPTTIFAENITVEKDEVNISLVEASSVSSYAGYVYKIEDGNLFIGINQNMFLSLFNGTIDYNILIPTKAQKIENIYFKDNENIWLIWNVDEGKLKSSDIKPQKY